MRNLSIILVVMVLIAGFILLKLFNINLLPIQNTPKQTSAPVTEEKTSRDAADDIPRATVIAQDLDTPWALAFLPDKSMLVTERAGRVRLIDSSGNLQAEPVAVINQVKEIGEGGLLGIALHPDFSANNFVYLYYTYSGSGNNTLNRVVRMTYQDNRLADEKIIVNNIPGASNHNGGRIKFGPDGYLYITTGDAENPSQAQNKGSLAGKILRITGEGESASGNPFNNRIYSYGHRNPQGLTWDGNGRLWATEHGRSGVLSGLDELNLIEPGKNYGWPLIEGDKVQTGMESPKLNSGPDATWAPAGAAFYRDSVFFGGLRGEALYEANIEDSKITLKEYFQDDYGRIRDVVLGPDDLLYITTSNKDGWGDPVVGDDKIIKINPRKL